MKILELQNRVFSDYIPHKQTDALFLFGQTADNQDSAFYGSKKVIKESLAKKILLINCSPKSGYPGFELWEKGLIQMGIPSRKIEGIFNDGTPTLNTLIEAQATINHCKEKGYKTLIVMASPFQQLRAFMTAVTVALKIYPSIKIYSIFGEPLRWQEKVTHSQGTLTGNRKDLIYGELERIDIYNKKGDLASVEEVLDYLNQRD
ncbi:MAG: YdcF family protein [Flammeovirgaceae bacterium]|nr:YdcF family protein [Flammeovirgaceae bacterium]